jgi:transposase-like protein
VAAADAERIKELAREHRELRQGNEILKAPSASFISAPE